MHAICAGPNLVEGNFDDTLLDGVAFSFNGLNHQYVGP